MCVLCVYYVLCVLGGPAVTTCARGRGAFVILLKRLMDGRRCRLGGWRLDTDPSAMQAIWELGTELNWNREGGLELPALPARVLCSLAVLSFGAGRGG